MFYLQKAWRNSWSFVGRARRQHQAFTCRWVDRKIVTIRQLRIPITLYTQYSFVSIITCIRLDVIPCVALAGNEISSWQKEFFLEGGTAYALWNNEGAELMLGSGSGSIVCRVSSLWSPALPIYLSLYVRKFEYVK